MEAVPLNVLCLGFLFRVGSICGNSEMKSKMNASSSQSCLFLKRLTFFLHFINWQPEISEWVQVNVPQQSERNFKNTT